MKFVIEDDGIYIVKKYEVNNEVMETIDLVIPKETFIDAYKKYILEDTSSNSGKEVI